jgi:hypothetical protein
MMNQDMTIQNLTTGHLYTSTRIYGPDDLGQPTWVFGFKWDDVEASKYDLVVYDYKLYSPDGICRVGQTGVPRVPFNGDGGGLYRISVRAAIPDTNRRGPKAMAKYCYYRNQRLE